MFGGKKEKRKASEDKRVKEGVLLGEWIDSTRRVHNDVPEDKYDC